MREMLQDLNEMLRREGRGATSRTSRASWTSGASSSRASKSSTSWSSRCSSDGADAVARLKSARAAARAEQMMQSLVQDEACASAAGQLAHEPGRARADGRPARRYPFRGEDSLNLEQAHAGDAGAQEMDRLERQIREALDTERPENDRPRKLRELSSATTRRGSSISSSRSPSCSRRPATSSARATSCELTPRAIRKIGQKALRDIFQHLARDRFGNHAIDHRGAAATAATTPSPTSSATRSCWTCARRCRTRWCATGPGRRCAWSRTTSRSIRTEQMNQAATVLHAGPEPLDDLPRLLPAPRRRWRWRCTR